MENVIYGQVNAARKKELRDEKEKARLNKMVNKLSAELAEARKPKDPVAMIRKIHMLSTGQMKIKPRTLSVMNYGKQLKVV